MEVQTEEDKKQPEKEFTDLPTFLNVGQSNSPVYIGPESEGIKSKFETQVSEIQKKVEQEVAYREWSTKTLANSLPENDWRDIPGFSKYQMNGLGVIRSKESKAERSTYVKLWRGGGDEVVIGVDALRAMTFGVKDG